MSSEFFCKGVFTSYDIKLRRWHWYNFYHGCELYSTIPLCDGHGNIILDLDLLLKYGCIELGVTTEPVGLLYYTTSIAVSLNQLEQVMNISYTGASQICSKSNGLQCTVQILTKP